MEQITDNGLHLDFTSKETLLGSGIVFVLATVVRFFEKRRMKKRLLTEEKQSEENNG